MSDQQSPQQQWFQDQDNDDLFIKMVETALMDGVWKADMLEQARGWIAAKTPEERLIRRIYISNVLNFEMDGVEDEIEEGIQVDADEVFVRDDKRLREEVVPDPLLEEPLEELEEAGVIKKAFLGRTGGSKRSKIICRLSKTEDGGIHIRLDDAFEENSMFWVEGVITKDDIEQLINV